MRPQHENDTALSLTAQSANHAPKHRSSAASKAARGVRAHLPRIALVVALAAAVLVSGTTQGSQLGAAPGTGQTGADRSGAAALSSAQAAPAAATVSTVSLAAKQASRKKAAKLAAKKRAAKKKAARAVYEKKLKRLAKKRPRTAAKKIMTIRNYSKAQRSCVIKLWDKESNWRWWADNPSSSAYGIPQALPGRKMASAGSDWRTNPVTQIRWGLKYIKDRHGSPCGAWNHSKQRGWY